MRMFECTKTLWRRLLGAKTGSTGVASAEDRRVSYRYPADRQLMYRSTEEIGQHYTAQLRNISLGGMNLVVDRLYQPGDLLSVDIPEKGQASMSTLLACVVHVSPLGENQWSLGCTFSGDVTEQDLGTFGANFGADEEQEQRNKPRYHCAIEASYQIVGADQTAPVHAEVLNISTTGVGLLANQHVPAGTLLNIDFCAPQGHKALSILSCVVHTSDREGGGQALGCNFITEMSEVDLQELLAAP
jgi:c-di-GMP-binding flagellar brake protein YcgR